MPDHLTPEQLDQYRRGTAAPDDLLAFDDHLAQCEQCREALEKLVSPMALTTWAAGLARYDQKKEEQQVPGEPVVTVKAPVQAPTARHWPRLFWIPALAAALVLAVVLWKRPSASLQSASTPAFTAELRDAGGVVGLDASGVLHAPAGVAEADQALLAEALKTKALAVVGIPVDLTAPPGTLLGTFKPDEFAPLAPLSIMVYSDRPEFTWQGLKGAQTYEVQVFDSDFKEVDSSGKIRETHWTPVQALPRGALYQWQVIAYRANDSVRTPTPPAPDARFRVLNAEMFGKIEAARAGSAHLLAAILLAKAGMKDEARKELDALAAENPDSAVAREMIASLDR